MIGITLGRKPFVGFQVTVSHQTSLLAASTSRFIWHWKAQFLRAKISPACQSHAASSSIPAKAAICVKSSKRVCLSFRDVEDSPGKRSMLILTPIFAASSTMKFLSFSSTAAKLSSTGWTSRNSCENWRADSVLFPAGWLEYVCVHYNLSRHAAYATLR